MPRQSVDSDDPLVDLFQHRRPQLVQGVFRSEAMATAVARELKAAYPDRAVVVVDDERVLVR